MEAARDLRSKFVLSLRRFAMYAGYNWMTTNREVFSGLKFKLDIYSAHD
jgi:hypothetical protein